jgi:uncharacterized repeat protein (TIGR03803 family)
LYSFPLENGAGGAAQDLIQASDGNFYGVTQKGGANLEGILFRITPAGTFTSLHSFGGTVGADPISIVQGADGDLYGVTLAGGSEASGTFFKVTTSGQVIVLHDFNYTPDGGGPDTALIQGSDGNFYGATEDGGGTSCNGYPDNCGTIYKLTPSGDLSVVEDLPPTNDGQPPLANALAEGLDGIMYDTTEAGGTSSQGSFFIPSASGDLYDFGANGSYPIYPNAVVLGSDGAFYGTSVAGGTNGIGTVFKITPTGNLTTVYNFSAENQVGYPEGSLLQGSDGNFYGGAFPGGGSNDCSCGAIFKASVSLPPPIQLSFSNLTPAVSQSVTLGWQVLNAPSLTFQQCYAFVQNNATGAGSWTGLQRGSVVNGIYQGAATITPTAAGVYTYALTCGGVESGFASLQVGGAKAATTTAANANTPVTLGSVVTLTATASTLQNIGTITGTVAFSYGTLALGTVKLTNGTASLNVNAQGIPTGTYQITASYSGDSNYLPSSGTTSVTVLGYTTATTLSASPLQLTQGQSTTLSATASRTSVSGTPTGNITFSYGSTVLGTAKLTSGKAIFTAATNGSIPSGTYAVTAKYDGDSTDQTSTSAPVNVTVIAATQTSLSVSPTTVPKDSAVTLTSVIKRKYNAGVPTGSVTFSVGSTIVGTQPLDGTGTAVVNASSIGIPPGTYRLTATYSGDSANAASSSPSVDVKVQ